MQPTTVNDEKIESRGGGMHLNAAIRTVLFSVVDWTSMGVGRDSSER